MMQVTSPSAQPGGNQSLEVQNRPVHVERIDPVILQFIGFLFPCQFEGVKFLALLCRRATEKQLAFYRESVAVITFHGIAALCATPEWPWGYHATSRYFIIFEALGILTRARKNRITEVHIPLGVREDPLTREQLLASLGNLQKQTSKKREYKDKKLVQLIARVKKHIEVYGLGTSGDSQKEMFARFDPLLLSTAQERLIEAMRAERIPVAKCKRIAQWVYTHEVSLLIRDQIGTGQPFVGGQLPLQPGDPQIANQERAGRYQCTLGDSQRNDSHTHTAPQGDAQDAVGDSQNESKSLEQREEQAQTTQNRPPNQQDEPSSELSTLTEQAETPILAPEATPCREVGDSEQCLSSNISLFHKNFSNKIGNDIEKAPEAASSKSPHSEESILAEATWIAIELDGEESLKLNRGKGWIGAYKKKLEENAYLVRVSMIDMFMQRFFPDWQGPPQGRGGRWFNRAYKAYALEEVPVPADIESWARSLYSYKQIKKALFLERQRQEGEIKEIQRRCPFSTETFLRPLADCVEAYGLLRGDQGTTPASEVYHDPFPDEEASVVLPGEHGGDEIERDAVEMEDGTLLSLEEYEQLEARAREEECRRVKTLVSDTSLADLLRDYVEQWVAAGLASLPAAVIDDLQHLRAILDPKGYTVDVQFATGDSCVFKVQSKSDPTNVCVLADSEQTQMFLRRFGGSLPVPLSDDLQRLRAALDPELYLAEVLLTLDGPYSICVRARTNPSNACLLLGPGQVRIFLDWFTRLPAAVLDDLQRLRAILDPEVYTVGIQLTPAEQYVILIWADDDPANACRLEGPEQTLEFIHQFTQEKATDPDAAGFVEELTEQELLCEELYQEEDALQ